MSALERIKMAPTFGNGKICYIEMPATDIDRSAEFYQKIFGWDVRKRGDGSIGFDDGVGEVSGTWVLGRQPVSGAGMVVADCSAGGVAAAGGAGTPGGSAGASPCRST